MRIKTDKVHFTRAERIFARILLENHIPFKTKVKIGGREIDFLIGNKAIEIDGHEQASEKNVELAALGYVPIHFSNQEVYKSRDKLINKIK